MEIIIAVALLKAAIVPATATEPNIATATIKTPVAAPVKAGTGLIPAENITAIGPTIANIFSPASNPLDIVEIKKVASKIRVVQAIIIGSKLCKIINRIK
ncbi:MAG: hypothetical protein V7K58_01625 [Nostoc sp.]